MVDGWQDDLRRYSCLSVGLTQRSVKEISDLENEVVNLIVGCMLFKYVMNSCNLSSPCDIQGWVRCRQYNATS